MKKLNLSDVKLIELSLLIKVDKLCREHNIKYGLAGGSLLGAIRHKGFIPWDDDIDLFMPRESYEKFISICKIDSNIQIKHCWNDKEYCYTFAKVIAPGTVICEKVAHVDNKANEICIDIFPVDNCGNSKIIAIFHVFKYMILKYLLVGSSWQKFVRNENKSMIREILRFVFFLLGRCVSANALAKFLDKQYRTNNVKKTKYSVCFSGVYGFREIFKTDDYFDFIEYEFENLRFYSMRKYDEYLRSFYGEYMKLPSLEKRNNPHIFAAYDLNE